MLYEVITAEENRVWGVITSWRQKRRLFERIQREHAPVKGIEITNIDFEKNTANVKMSVRSRSDYPSYTMRNYKLVYQFTDSVITSYSIHYTKLYDDYVGFYCYKLKYLLF